MAHDWPILVWSSYGKGSCVIYFHPVPIGQSREAARSKLGRPGSRPICRSEPPLLSAGVELLGCGAVRDEKAQWGGGAAGAGRCVLCRQQEQLQRWMCKNKRVICQKISAVPPYSKLRGLTNKNTPKENKINPGAERGLRLLRSSILFGLLSSPLFSCPSSVHFRPFRPSSVLFRLSVYHWLEWFSMA